MNYQVLRRAVWMTGALAVFWTGMAHGQFEDPPSVPPASDGDPIQQPAMDVQLGPANATPADALPPALNSSENSLGTTASAGPNAIPGLKRSKSKRSVMVQYVDERPVVETRNEGGREVHITRYVKEVKQVQIALDDEIETLDLPPDGKRAAVLALTAARHDDLLNALKVAKTTEEKEEASEALKENYTEHYAIETWWREQRLAELEARIKEMRDQVKQRQDSEEKYVTAAMTIAELWADGIAIAPPKPGRSNDAIHGSTFQQPNMTTHGSVLQSPGVGLPHRSVLTPPSMMPPSSVKNRPPSPQGAREVPAARRAPSDSFAPNRDSWPRNSNTPQPDRLTPPRESRPSNVKPPMPTKGATNSWSSS